MRRELPSEQRMSRRGATDDPRPRGRKKVEHHIDVGRQLLGVTVVPRVPAKALALCEAVFVARAEETVMSHGVSVAVATADYGGAAAEERDGDGGAEGGGPGVGAEEEKVERAMDTGEEYAEEYKLQESIRLKREAWLRAAMVRGGQVSQKHKSKTVPSSCKLKHG
ncbi:hypothetical protein BHE74_00029810 [Ensete ventricosum]|nr:hypothetical protein BHE74_00029810 [Ensete ventricosum]